MTEPFFFKQGPGLTVREIAALTAAEPNPGADPERRVRGVAALDRATPDDLTFLDNPKFADQAAKSHAGVCLTSERLAARISPQVAVLIAREPYRAFVQAARELFPGALRPSSLFEAAGVAAGALVHPAARLESGVIVDPTAVIGPRAEIGAGSVIGAGAVIGPDVRIGRDCAIGPRVCLANALVGDRVTIHAGCSIGQDGFGFLMGAGGHRKVPQIGRVIIQDDVEIGAGTAIDRGGIRDTTIGEGSKIDNLVQIGHNVSIGRHCVIVSQAGISGSVVMEDYVVIGGQVGIADNMHIGEGAMIGAKAGVMTDVPAGGKWVGSPAMPSREFFRQVAALRRLAEDAKGRPAGERNDRQ